MRKIIALITGLLVLACHVHAQEIRPYTGVTPVLQLKDLQGKQHNLTDYRGSIVMVQFWATYCAPCLKEMPSMQRLEARLKGKPFKILAVNMGESEAEVREFQKRVNVDFTMLMDTQGEALAAWKVFVAPSTFIVDPQGKIRYTVQGGAEWDEAEYVNALTALLKKK